MTIILGTCIFLRALQSFSIEVVAINNTSGVENCYYLLKYDSNFRMFDSTGISYDEDISAIVRGLE